MTDVSNAKEQHDLRNSWAALDDGGTVNDINQVVAVILLIVAIGFVTFALFFRILGWLPHPKRIWIDFGSPHGANK